MIAGPRPTAMKRIARFGLHRLGGLQPLIWKSRKRFRILTYHRFSRPEVPGPLGALDRQCEFVGRQFHPLPLSEIARSLNSGETLPPGALAVTVDDGFRDFLLDAFPIFQKWRIPVTVFLMTDFIDGKLWPWWSQVAYAARHGRARQAHLALLSGGAERELPLETLEQRQRAEAAICEQVVNVPIRRRGEFLNGLGDMFDVEIPPQAPPEYAALTWNEVRQLASAGVEFGAHSKSHPILPLENEESIAEEIAGSKMRIEQELGRPVSCFCYPNGDYNDAAVGAVERCGFQAAVTVDAGLNTVRANRYLLKRLSVSPEYSDEYFRELVAGMHV